MNPPDGLSHELVGTTTTIRLTGDVDFVNARELAMRVEQLCADAEAVVLDLAATTYLDSAGVRLVDGAARACAERGIPLALYVPRGAVVRRVVELTLPTLELIEDVWEWDASRPGRGS
jgi:anti-anti-sigma factor